MIAGQLNRRGNGQRHVALLVRARQRRIDANLRAQSLDRIGSNRARAGGM